MTAAVASFLWRLRGSHLWTTATLVLLTVAVGTIGYMVIEGWSLNDAFFMTIITLSTVGYSELHPLSLAGRIFTSVLILGGVGTLFYAFTTVSSWIVENEINEHFPREQMRRRIHGLQQHVIVCGFGRVGQAVAAELQKENLPFVVVEQDQQRFDECRSKGFLAVLGDATQDAVLEQAGITRARGIVIALDDDARNVFITLTARALQPNIYIVSRAAQATSEPRLVQAGANRVVSPYTISGRRMAALISRPNVVEFIETALHGGASAYSLEEFVIGEDSSLAGKTITEINLRASTGATILAIIGKAGTLTTNPSNDRHIEPGDTLVAIGTPDQLAALEDFALGRRTGAMEES